MPTIARQTVTTTTHHGGSIRRIPIWSIKMLTAVLSIIALVLVFMHRMNYWHAYAKTFIAIILTSGFLLGWALPPVLNRFLNFHRVDVLLYTLIAVMTVLTTVACIFYLMDNSSYSRSDEYRFMLGIAVCLGVEAVVACVLVSWVCCGSYTVIETN